MDRVKIQINNINIHIFTKNKSAKVYLNNDEKTQYGSIKKVISKTLNYTKMDPNTNSETSLTH
jgi:hypothetical protein